jgi:putative ABC transport system ATP-binding protein
MAEPFLRLHHLGRSVPRKTILDDITLDVARGELFAIVGPSGSGKSSLLRLLNRLDEPTSGTVYIEGRDYRTMAPRELRRRAGMMMQHAFLFPGTVAANVRFGPSQRGERPGDAAVEELLRQVDLAGFGPRDVGQLSGGEAQRVSLARALANRPDLLLLDEPTSALNEDLKRQVEGVLTEVARAHGLTCVLVTHDNAQAARFAARAAVLEAGRLVRSGITAEVLDVESRS